MAQGHTRQIKTTYSLLGLFEEDATEFIKSVDAKNQVAIPDQVVAVAEERWQARLNKDWAKSDELRAVLSELGYDVKDSKEGYTLSKR